MKLKILKKMIAAVCVATIATSSVAPSVGAFNPFKNSIEAVEAISASGVEPPRNIFRVRSLC